MAGDAQGSQWNHIHCTVLESQAVELSKSVLGTDLRASSKSSGCSELLNQLSRRVVSIVWLPLCI